MAADHKTPLGGTRPEGVTNECEAASRVRDMFARIAPRYDFLNHLLSFSLDRLWRRRTAKHFLHILQRPDAQILDVCCGTGDLAFALDRTRSISVNSKPVVGADFVEPMLVRGREKASVGSHLVAFAAADALHLPFADATFDLLTTAFGFRNLASYEDGLREFSRVLKRGGELGILEFTEPASGVMAGVFRFYFKNILPRLGGAISGSSDAYKYLPTSVSKFPSPQELKVLMQQCGFTGVEIQSWNFGSVILHSARRI